MRCAADLSRLRPAAAFGTICAAEERMGLVKTRRFAAMQKQQRAKAAMKPPMKGAFRSIPEKAGKGRARVK